MESRLFMEYNRDVQAVVRYTALVILEWAWSALGAVLTGCKVTTETDLFTYNPALLEIAGKESGPVS